jgi:hypothetical protein
VALQPGAPAVRPPRQVHLERDGVEPAPLAGSRQRGIGSRRVVAQRGERGAVMFDHGNRRAALDRPVETRRVVREFGGVVEPRRRAQRDPVRELRGAEARRVPVVKHQVAVGRSFQGARVVGESGRRIADEGARMGGRDGLPGVLRGPAALVQQPAKRFFVTTVRQEGVQVAVDVDGSLG